MRMQHIPMIRQESPRTMYLQRQHLMQTHELVPPRFRTGHGVEFGVGAHDALFGGDVGFFVGGVEIVPVGVCVSEWLAWEGGEGITMICASWGFCILGVWVWVDGAGQLR